MPVLHTEADYAEVADTRRLIDQGCAILQCERSDLLRMTEGLITSIELMRRLLDGGTVSDEQIAALPKRYRKPFKRLGRARCL